MQEEQTTTKMSDVRSFSKIKQIINTKPHLRDRTEYYNGRLMVQSYYKQVPKKKVKYNQN